MSDPKTICLVMIVKDEAAVIRRCLGSVRPIISHWVICDTGSADNTKEVVQETLRDIPGELYDDPWVNFAHNRTRSLQRARGKADYHLLIDADMVLNIRPDFSRELEADAYLIGFEGPLDFKVVRLVNDRHDWRYFGSAHEFIHSDTASTVERLSSLSLTHHGDSGAGSEKFQRYVCLLSEAVKEEPGNARNVFYLAQSYRDVGDYTRALDWYEKRALMGGWEQETWHALYQIGRMQLLLGSDWRVVLNSLLQAYEFRPSRLEPLLPIARFYREHQQYRLAYLFSRAVVESVYPDDILFIERSVYHYELPSEYAICCYWLGKHEEAIRVNDLILQCPNLPENYRESAERNRKLSVEALKASPTTNGHE
ncbi:MAG: glycosyltransferase [Verrucomicrobia bacterium]|nr:glycosyltransferase [Verrucomicrobiota bacterium]